MSSLSSPSKPSLPPPRRLGLGAVAAVLFLAATAILASGVQPTPRFSLERHWHEFAPFALVGGILMAGACALVRSRYRVPCGVASIVLLAVAALAHPICVLIPKAERPSFETVIPLRERALRGEPFCRFGDDWYQCKSFISRTFFF
jgi:hypothetical protein